MVVNLGDCNWLFHSGVTCAILIVIRAYPDEDTDKDRFGSGAATRSLSIAIWEPDRDLTDVCAKLDPD